MQVNLVLLGSVVRVFLKLKSNSQKSDWLKLRRCAKAIGLLTPLMGLSWLFGVLAFNDDTKWFSYVFVLTNSFQVNFVTTKTIKARNNYKGSKEA